MAVLILVLVLEATRAPGMVLDNRALPRNELFYTAIESISNFLQLGHASTMPTGWI